MEAKGRTKGASMVKLAAVVVSLGLLAGACSGDGGGDKYSPLIDPGTGSNLETGWSALAALNVAKSCDEAEAWFKEMLTTSMLMQLEQTRQNFLDGGWFGYKGLAEDGAENAAPAAEEQGGASEYTDTNVQVAGVDEADFVKTDGNLMYVLAGNELVIVDAWPAEQMHEAGRVAIKGSPYAFYRYESRLVVLSWADRNQLSAPDGEDPEGKVKGEYYYWEPMTLVTVVDAQKPEAPIVTSEQAFDGYLLSSRRIDGRLYLVQQNYLYKGMEGINYWPDIPYDSSDEVINEAFTKLAQQNKALIAGLSLDDFLPRTRALTEAGFIEEGPGDAMVACTQVFSPSVFSGYGALAVVTVDLDQGKILPGSMVLGDWGTIYASLDALYIASTNWSWGWWYQDQEDTPDVTTHLHKFAFDDKSGAAQYRASGAVPGYVLNQFSLDELDGNLRVATTQPDWWWWGNDDEVESESFVTVLAEQSGKLAQLGQVSGLGKGETIHSVRFIGELGYVVTFRQTDPLYVLDLSKPATPTVVGELKVPGFSSYMHPLDQGHLLTIGQDANEEGQVIGLQFQIFDVSDPTNPKQTAKTTLGKNDWSNWSWSEALWDHHAFVYFAAKGLLAVPVSGWTYDDKYEYGGYYSYLQMFKVSIEDGIQMAGQVSHLDMLAAPEPLNDCQYSYYGWYGYHAEVRRGVFMDDFLYSVSNLGLKVHPTSNLASPAIATVAFMDTKSLQDEFARYNGYCYADDEL